MDRFFFFFPPRPPPSEVPSPPVVQTPFEQLPRFFFFFGLSLCPPLFLCCDRKGPVPDWVVFFFFFSALFPPLPRSWAGFHKARPCGCGSWGGFQAMGSPLFPSVLRGSALLFRPSPSPARKRFSQACRFSDYSPLTFAASKPFPLRGFLPPSSCPLPLTSPFFFFTSPEEGQALLFFHTSRFFSSLLDPFFF